MYVFIFPFCQVDMGNIPAILRGNIDATTIKELPTELQNSLQKLGVTCLKPSDCESGFPVGLHDLDEKVLQTVPMFLRYKFDRDRVPILHSVVLIIMVISVMGSSTALFLKENWERAVLSLSYCLLLVAASMNQGLIDRKWEIVDVSAAIAITILNIYFWALSMEWYHWLIGGSSILYFFSYNLMFLTHTVRQYEIHTNIWHLSVILMIYLVPLQLEQKNLF